MSQIFNNTQAGCRRSIPHHFLHTIAAAGLLTAVALIVQLLDAPPLNAQSSDRPNIVLIFTDDQGWNDIGC
ncbi:MAG: arylsulfatase, partial [Candidatus Paceibacterota bacterium]